MLRVTSRHKETALLSYVVLAYAPQLFLQRVVSPLCCSDAFRRTRASLLALASPFFLPSLKTQLNNNNTQLLQH